MSDYTKLVDFAVKDALSVGDPDKKILGTQLGAEFDAIAVAIATKFNIAAALGKVQVISSVSGTNTVLGTITGYASYSSGDTLLLVPANDVTGATTLNVNSLGAKTVLNKDGSALVGKELKASNPYVLYYNGTNFYILNPSPSYGSFTGTLTGMSSATTATFEYRLEDDLVIITNPSSAATTSGTSNSTSFTITGLPAAIQPTVSAGGFIRAINNGDSVIAQWLIEQATPGTIIMGNPVVTGTQVVLTNLATWTSSGEKGIGRSGHFIYRKRA